MPKENSWTRLVKFRLPMRKGEFCCFSDQGKNSKTMKSERQLSGKVLKKIQAGQRGLTLIEVLIGVVLLTMISVAAFIALSGVMNAVVVSNKRTTPVSLANTIMENTKGTATTYQFAMGTNGNALPWVDYTSSLSSVLSSLPTGYHVYTLDDQGNMVADKVYGVPWNIKPTPSQYYNQPQYNVPNTVDGGIQRITVIIRYQRDSYSTARDQPLSNPFCALTDPVRTVYASARR